MIRSGAIGELKKIRVCVGNPPVACDLPTEPTPEGIDWDAWLGPAPMRGFSKSFARMMYITIFLPGVVTVNTVMVDWQTWVPIISTSASGLWMQTILAQ